VTNEDGPEVTINVSCFGCVDWHHPDYWGKCMNPVAPGKGTVAAGQTPAWCPRLPVALRVAHKELRERLAGNSVESI